MKEKLENKVILLRIAIFPVISCALLSFGIFQSTSGNVFAQSLLSDSTWLEQNSEVTNKTESAGKTEVSGIAEISEESEDSGQNTPHLPADLFSTPTTLSEPVQTRIESSAQNYPVSPSISKKPALPLINEEEGNTIFSGSFLSRLFPWFSDEEQTESVNPATEKEASETLPEWADVEFSGVYMLVAEIERLLILNPEEARERYLEIENQLEIEERTRLKVQLLYYLNEWNSAEQLAEAFVNERPNSPLSSLMFYYLNKSLLSQNKALNQNLIMLEGALKSLEPKLLSDLLRILSDEALLQGDLFTAVNYRLDELNDPETANMADLEKLLSLLKEVQSREELQIISANYPNIAWLREQISSMELELLVKQERYREALELVDRRLDFARESGDAEEVELLEQMQNNFTTALNVSPRRIGVILPLSSSSAKVAGLAQETLNGLWLALRAHEKSILTDNQTDNATLLTNELSANSQIADNVTVETMPKKPAGPWELVVRDSHLNLEKTKSAIRELVEKERVIAVIGPLARKTSEAAAEEAEKLRVPLISLSLTAGIPELGDYIFRNNQSWNQEVLELLEYAVSELQACRFLILYAKTREGRQKMRLFWDAALRKGCEVVAVEGYKDEGQKSLVNEFDTFTGKNQRMTTKDKSILKDLKEKEDPIHNFDAVFVAVGSGGVKNLRLIFPYSAVYKMEKTIFLGDSGWNDSALPFVPGLRGVKKPVFVDSFFPQSNTPAMKKLLRLHERMLYRHQNYIGPTHYTAYAYDTLMILMKLLEDKSNQTHRDLRYALANMQTYAGVTGNLRFDERGEVQREMQLLTLRRGKIQLLKH